MLFDHTLVDTFERCETEGAFRFRDHLEPGTPDAARLFGQAVHAGVRQFYEQPYNTPAMLGAVERVWNGATFGPREYRTLTYALNLVATYATQYPPSKWDFEVVLNERYMENTVTGECGIVDRVVRRKTDGALFVRDLKTTGLYLSPAWQEQWRHSQQAARYLDLVEHTLVAEAFLVENEETVSGFLCDAIHLDRRGYAKPDDFTVVGPFYYSAALRDELREQRTRKGSRISKIIGGAETPIKNTSHCFRWNAICPFLRFCVADPSDRKDMLALAVANGELIKREWKPQEREI